MRAHYARVRQAGCDGRAKHDGGARRMRLFRFPSAAAIGQPRNRGRKCTHPHLDEAHPRPLTHHERRHAPDIRRGAIDRSLTPTQFAKAGRDVPRLESTAR